jgi:gliding motility-associated-like protein
MLLLTFVKLNAQLNANFTIAPSNGCQPILVNFTNTSTGNPVSFFWDFGNGTQSTLANPSSTYFNAGVFNVKLVITNAAGDKDSIIKTNAVTVHPKPIVNFTAIDSVGCAPFSVQFQDISSPTPGATNVSWIWDFGNGVTSTQQNPIHTYAQGVYTVVLQVTNDKGCVSTFSKPNFINAQQGITANFTSTVVAGCSLPATVNFTSAISGSAAVSYLWNFGGANTSTVANPSFSFTSNGTYPVSLIVTNANGCSDTIINNVNINVGSNTVGFTAPSSGCNNSNINFTNTSVNGQSYNWSFGDGGTSTQTNPTHIYSNPGTYIVKLVVNFGGCFDSIQQSITINLKPVASFTTNDTTNCKAPHTVNFNNNSTSGSSYLWNFGDGNTSTLNNPTHTYTNTGSYTVSLIVTSAQGCSDTLIRNNYINIVIPTLTLSGLPYLGCVPYNYNASFNLVSNDPVQSYAWNFGNGNTSTAANPTFVYTTAGNYGVSLTITTVNGCIVTASDSIKLGNKPNANFTATPTNTCAEDLVNFSDNSTGNNNYWFWSFGDGSTTIGYNPSHGYNDTGYFTVTLIVGDNGCFDTATIVDYIYVNPPISRFNMYFNCDSPFKRTFVDTSIMPLTWFWDFGDGVTSTQPNPIHYYTQQGNFLVKLTVTNGACSHESERYIDVIDEQINFNINDSIICRGNYITFASTFLKRSNITQFFWDFGDGTSTTSDSVVSHTYSQSGFYNITLTITDLNGCTRTITKGYNVLVYGPDAGFQVPPSACVNSNVLFQDTSNTDGIHPIVNWAWNFGDGNIQSYSNAPFSHTYLAGGAYNVQLVVTDSYGCKDSILHNNIISIAQPIAAFSSNDTATCPNTNVAFINSSTGNSLTYNWNFGNGVNSGLTNPTVTYNSQGNYDVSLIVTDNIGCKDTATNLQYIKILEPVSFFTVNDSVGTCPPFLVNFTAAATNGISILWDFGDGSSAANNNTPSHFYTAPGIYIAKLIVTSQGGCTDTFQKTIRVQGPTGTLTYAQLSGCKPHTVSFNVVTQNTSSVVFDMGNGQTFSTTQNQISYSYPAIGAFLPRVILVDTSGCSIPIVGADSIKIFGVQSSLTANTQIVCDSGIVSFSNVAVSNATITSFLWNFGDGTSSNIQHPTHNYTQTGVYNVSCITNTNIGCRDTAYLLLPINVSTTPQIDFTPLYTNTCIPATVNFAPQVIVGDSINLNWNWNMGNGNTHIGVQPATQIYNTLGPKNVTAIAVTSLGCADTLVKTFTIAPYPVINAGLDRQICRFDSLQLQATGGSTYVWSPIKGLNCTNCASPKASPDSTLVYVVHGTSDAGCTSVDSVKINVIQKLEITNSPNVGFCKDGFTVLNANGASSYLWYPSTGLNSTTDSTVIAKPITTTTYNVVGSDAHNCFKDTAQIVVTVSPLPTVNAGPDLTIVGGSTVTLQPLHSPNVTQYNWHNGSSLSCINCKNPVATPSETTTYKLEVVTDQGCKNSDEVTVFVLCDKANVFVPNTFSPNNDGMNDIMYPRGKGIHKIVAFRIYNRWGEVVFEKNNFDANDVSKAWDGTYKGQKLAPDVYVYALEVQCNNKTKFNFNGNITLIR